MCVHLVYNELNVIVDKRDIFSNILYLLCDTIVRHSSTPWRIVAETDLALKVMGSYAGKKNCLRTNENMKKIRIRLSIGHGHC